MANEFRPSSGRVRSAGEILDGDAVVDSEGKLGDKLGCVRCHDSGAE